MKKVFLILFLYCLAISVFAELTPKLGMGIKIVSVTGNVKYEVMQGEWAPVKLDSELTLKTIINTGINSTLVFETTDKEIITIKAMKKGLIVDFMNSNDSGFSGINLNGTLTNSDVNADDIQERTNIGTASTRASEATEDFEWVEDE